MLIKSRMGVSADWFVSTPDGVPAIAVAPGVEPGISHGYPEFIEGCSSPLPADTPEDVGAARQGPADLVGQLRSRPSGGDVRLVGGPRTIPRSPAWGRWTAWNW